MGQVKTEKTFYRNFFSIYIVLVLQNVVTISVNLADNVMLGDGLVIFCSQYWGKRQTQSMRRISAAASAWSGRPKSAPPPTWRAPASG